MLLTALVAVVAYSAAHAELTRYFRVAPAIEDLVAACYGRPGFFPDARIFYQLPAWTALYERKISLFPCDAIAGVPLVPLGAIWHQQLYFHVALYSWFRVVGPTVDGFLSFQSASYAITCVMAYLIFRLAMPRLIALACAGGFIFSASHLGKVGLPIEYAKAPWVLAVVLLCAWMVIRDENGRPIRWVALALGLVAGLGIGFKQDLLAVAPLAVITPLVFVRPASGERFRRLIAATLVVAGIAAAGGVMIYRNLFSPYGSLFAVQILGGQDWQTESLHAVSPLYDYGITWDDSHVVMLINSYGRRVLGTTGNAGFLSRELQHVSTDLVVQLWRTFPGDLILRAIAAVVRVVRLNEFSPFIALAGLVVVLASRIRIGWFVLFVTAYLAFNVSLVFQRRHVFHLEFIPWLLAGIVATALLSARGAVAASLRRGGLVEDLAAATERYAPVAIRAGLSIAAVLAGTWLTLTIARSYQHGRVLDLVERYRVAPTDVRAVTWAPTDGDETTARVSGLSLTDRSVPANVPVTEYLEATFTCREAGTFPVKSRYLPPEDATNWSRQFDVICSDRDADARLLLPVYQLGTRYQYDGLVMRKADAQLLASVAIVQADASIPLFLDLQVPADWQRRSWFERLRWPIGMPP